MIVDNDVFWNNFNYYKGAPFKVQAERDVRPVSGRRRRAALRRPPQPHREQPRVRQLPRRHRRAPAVPAREKDAQDLVGNGVRYNDIGLGGADPNGRDLFYDGNGTGNCFSDNVGVKSTFPADGSTFAACPFTGANTFNAAAQQQAVSWAVDADHEKDWIRGAHVAKAGLTPLERNTGRALAGVAPQRGAGARRGPKKTVDVGDYFFAPTKLNVKSGTTITWRWPNGGGDVHDVELVPAPKGVRKFVSDIATSGYSFKRKLTKKGTYVFTCSLHEEMRMTIKVRK